MLHCPRTALATRTKQLLCLNPINKPARGTRRHTWFHDFRCFKDSSRSCEVTARKKGGHRSAWHEAGSLG